MLKRGFFLQHPLIANKFLRLNGKQQSWGHYLAATFFETEKAAAKLAKKTNGIIIPVMIRE